MKKIFLLFIVPICAYTLSAQQNTKPIGHERPSEYEYLSAPDSVGHRTELKSPSNRTQALKLPYPILFLHGFNSGSSTWDDAANFLDTQYGLTFGGRLDFCLNYDANNNTANKNFDIPGADLALFAPNLVAGDCYYLNFDVGRNGIVSPASTDANFVLSNQSAVAKQGVALKWAINLILQETGRDKVVLMGHSMGGLAAREYLQNPAIWQPDGQSHVAKLATTGTPHGGSNVTGYGLLGSLNEHSESVRDLRTSYYYSLDSGVYLFGGIELQDNSTSMNDFSGTVLDFFNADVSSNGGEGEAIVGLNRKTMPNNIDYSCIMGDCNGCYISSTPGDGIVSLVSANIKSFYPNLSANLFSYNAGAYSEIHTALPKQNIQNMQGLDEPNEYALSYNIGFNINYTGFITEQPVGGYSKDYDDYKFSVPVNSNVSVSVNNIFLGDLLVRILNASHTLVGIVNHSNGASSVTFTQVLNAGDYYLEIYGIPTSTSYLQPYNFELQKTSLQTGVELSESVNNIAIYPNPVGNQLTIEVKNTDETQNFEILNSVGQTVYKSALSTNKTIINTDNFSNGVYLIKFDSEKSHTIRKFIKE